MAHGVYEDDGWRDHPERARRAHEVDLARHRSRECGRELPPEWEQVASEFVAGTFDEKKFGRRVSASQPLRTVFLHGQGYDPIRATELKCLHFTVEVTEAGIYWMEGDSNTPQDRQRITQDNF